MNINRTVNSESSAVAGAVKLQNTVNEAVRHFEHAFGPLAEEVRYDADSPSCMRVGYDYINKVVNFCNTNQVINQGIDSVDVVRHEVFHAMLCQKMPAVCDRQFLTATDNQALHEGLADFFAFTMAPDKNFGENFYKEKSSIREYRTGFCYSLVKGYHEKGNVIVSKLIANQSTLAEVAKKLESQNFSVADLVDAQADSCFSPDDAPSFSLVPDQVSESNLNRYRIALKKTLLLKPKFNGAFSKRFKNYKVTLEAPSNESFIISESADNQFTVQAVKEGPFVEAVMSVYAEGHLIGRAKYYFALSSARQATEKN